MTAMLAAQKLYAIGSVFFLFTKRDEFLLLGFARDVYVKQFIMT